MPPSPGTRGRRPTRRTVLAVLGTGMLTLGGCLAPASGETSTPACLESGRITLAGEDEAFVVRTGDDTVERFAFTLSNETSCQVTVGRGTWQLERLTDEESEVVAKGDETSGTRTLRSGESSTWSLSLQPRSTPEATATTHVSADLSEGQYVFVVAGMVGDETRFERSARFTLVKRTASSRVGIGRDS